MVYDLRKEWPAESLERSRLMARAGDASGCREGISAQNVRALQVGQILMVGLSPFSGFDGSRV